MIQGKRFKKRELEKKLEKSKSPQSSPCKATQQWRSPKSSPLPPLRGPPPPLTCLPPKLLKHLMPFQKEGVEFALSRNGRCMIADEMGLGKTVQAMAVAYAYRREWPLLVVVPSSLKYPWIEELERWIPELTPGDINLVESKSHTTGISSSKVTVLGYGLLTTDARPLVEALTRQRFAMVVVDESHYLKTRNAARTKILVPLLQSARRVVLLTGTPALGRPEELFMQIDALYPGRFGSWSEFSKKFCNAHYKYFGRRRQWDCRGASNLDELHQRLSEIMIRRLKAEVLTQLPPKVRQRIPFDLPKEAAKEASKCFEEWERLMKGQGSGFADPDNTFTEVMTLITRMYKQTAIAKAGAVKDYIKMMLETEKLKFLVFGHHLTMLQACTEAAIEAKAGYIRIDGSVPSSERIQLVHRFQSDPDTRVAILSIQAAGQGLTFTAASHVVFAELYWNPGQVKQAEDRAHRIGQTSSVHVHYLIAKGTFDTVMWGMLNRKETVTGSTLNGRKEYLRAEEGDKDKWDFLNFATAWTPSDTPLLPPPPDQATNDKNSVFFSHFEKDKQHDIRTFFSPGACKERKRKRMEDRVEGADDNQDEDIVVLSGETTPRRRRDKEEENPEDDDDNDIEDSSDSGGLSDPDFSPQAKRLRTPQGRPALAPIFEKKTATPPMFQGKRRRASSAASAGRPGSSPAPDKPSTVTPAPPPAAATWNCGVCTYSNSGLLPYCEMCESPRVSATSGSSEAAVKVEAAAPVKAATAAPVWTVSSSDSESEPTPTPADHHPRGRSHGPTTPAKSSGGKGGFRQKRKRGGSGGVEWEDDDEEDEEVVDETPPPPPKDKQKVCDEEEATAEEEGEGKQALGQTDAAADEDEGNDDDDGSPLPLYPGLQFCASRHTDRIFLYSKDDEPLNCNFIPLDIQLDNWEDLPRAFSKCTENRIQVVQFVREWSRLPAMKQRLLRRGGLLFHSPALGLEELGRKQKPSSSTKRYLDREDVAAASLSKAQQDGGSVRLVVKKDFFNKRRSATTLPPPAEHRQGEESSPKGVSSPPPTAVPPPPSSLSSPSSSSCASPPESSSSMGYLQAVDSEGAPLCLSCQEPCSTEGGPWDTRFCTQRCQEEFQLRTSQPYMRARVLEAEQGVCQQCGLQAHQLYLRVRDAPPAQRKDILENTWLAQMPLKQLNEMIRAPVEGDFWQVDHIRPVYSGGGQCSLDNLQTLCTVCHKARTAKQAKERSQIKKGQAAAKFSSDITKFFTKK